MDKDSGDRTDRKHKRKDKRAKSASRSRSSSSGSVFRVASSSKGRSSQARLIAWAAAHPGRLAAAGFEKMEDRVGRDGEAATWNRDATPAAAKSYYLRVLKLEHSTTRRNLSEMRSTAAALDHLALGRSKQAADLLMQRMKALELASSSGSWEKATFLELLETEEATLINKDEALMVAKETELNLRLSRRGSAGSNQDWNAWPGAWKGESGKSNPWRQDNGKDGWKGKGKDNWRSKGKGDKSGKSKGKGKKNNET